MRLGPGGAKKLRQGARALSLAATAVAAAWLAACGGDEVTEPTPKAPTTMTLPSLPTTTDIATSIPTYTEQTTLSKSVTSPTTTRTTTTLTTTTLPTPTSPIVTSPGNTGLPPVGPETPALASEPPG
jgi:hypothetical protein